MIIRADHEDNYSCLTNKCLRDKKLTYKARGLLHYMLSCKDDWNLNIKTITEMSDDDGERSVQTGLIELEKKGYLKRTHAKKSKKSGRYIADVEYTVFEVSQGIDFYAERMKSKENSFV